MKLDEKLDRIVARTEELRALLSDTITGEAFTRASKAGSRGRSSAFPARVSVPGSARQSSG